MLIFNNSKYELFFSNNLPPLIALNYADELFFKEFEQLCGVRYRILSIIRSGWQQKYGLSEDIEKLTTVFESKMENEVWASSLLKIYIEKSKMLREFLESLSLKVYSGVEDSELILDIKEVRRQSSSLDAMSNMLHLFSSLVGYQFFELLHTYSDDKDKINQNFIFYTQPIQESRFAKIEITELPDKIELSTRDANFSRILRIGAFVKDDVSELLDLRKDMMENLFKAVAGRIGCSAEDLEYLQISEIEDFLLKKESPSELIVQRRVVTVLFYPEDKLAVCAGDDAEHFIKEANMRELVETNQFTILKGQTASLGSVTGKIVVANNSGEALKKMKEGDILVAPYTAVEYVPAMQKAAAIITETGGITSHAAIVSRELKIPCIIGVKDATKVLKDGQLVEVDADNGSIELK